MLTVVMPVHGRESFTPRALAWLKKLPVKVIVADRQDGDSLPAYYRKMAKALAQVDTPYAMHADNDDFVGSHAVDLIETLERCPDLVSARGRQVTFHVKHTGEPKGRITRLYWQEGEEENGFNPRRYFAVYRTEFLKAAWEHTVEVNPTDIFAQERVFGSFVAMQVKHHWQADLVSYWSQAGGIHANGRRFGPVKDFVKSCLPVERHKRRLIELVPSAAADLAQIESCLA